MDDQPPLGISAEDWGATPLAVQAVVLAMQSLLERIPVMEARLVSLEAENADLRARLNQHSGNSSKPPSSDPPSAPPRRDRRQRGRDPGGQPEHAGTTRDPVPSERVDVTIPVRPAVCPDCQTSLAGCPLADVPPLRQQVWALPVVQPIITEYQLHCVTCPACSMAVRAPVPPDAPPGAFDASVAAAISTLHTEYRLSLREIPRLLRQFFQLPISVGSVTQLYHTMGEAAGAPYAEVEAVVREHDSNIDETSWPQGRLALWLWTMVTGVATLFRIGRRSRATLLTLIGDAYGKVLTSDRLRAYLSQPLERWQICWAHLRREFVAFYERDGPVGDWAAVALIQIDLTFVLWHGLRAGALDRAAFQAGMAGIQRAFHDLLKQGKDLPLEKARGFSRDLWNAEPALWTFVREAGIEPTNNAAERALRPAVLWRKGCHGTQTEAGSRAVERLLTIHATCRQQQCDPLIYLADLIRAHWAGQPAPSIFVRA